MGTLNLLFFLCAKKHLARNLLLLSNTSPLSFPSGTRGGVALTVPDISYLTGSHFQLFSSAYSRLTGTPPGFIASVYKYSPLQLSSIIPQLSSKHNNILPISP